MTSLIFGAIYMGHQGVVHHRREKKRVKNYERWEGLRDEYDEMKRTQRESRSLDIQRTGTAWEDDKPILTLRDQQEANDARTSWRPQESWHDPPPRRSVDVGSLEHAQTTVEDQPQRPSGTGVQRSTSLATGHNANRNSLPPQTTGYHGTVPMRGQPTGGTWDAGLPQPLRVARRNFDEQQHPTSSPLSRSASLRQDSSRGSGPSPTGSSSRLASTNRESPPIRNSSMSGRDDNSYTNNPFERPQQQSRESPPVAVHSRGRIEEEFTNNPFARPAVPPQPQQAQQTNNPFERQQQQPVQTNNPFEQQQQPAGGRMAQLLEAKSAGGGTPAGEKNMEEWWTR